jgi:hypothetical protein
MLDGGKATADSLSEDVSKKIAEVEAKFAKELEEKTKALTELQAERDRDKAAKDAAAQMESEKAGFVKWVTEGQEPSASDPSASEPVKNRYPLLAAEAPADVAEIAYKLGCDYAKANSKPATFEMVAAHLEQQLGYAKYQAEQKAKAVAPAEAPAAKKPAASPTVTTGPSKTAKSEPVPVEPGGPKQVAANTLTHNASAQRTASAKPRRRTEAQRLDEALSAWK